MINTCSTVREMLLVLEVRGVDDRHGTSHVKGFIVIKKKESDKWLKRYNRLLKVN